MYRLIPEITKKTVYDTRVFRSHIILFQDFQYHHFGPPIVGLAALKTIYVRMVFRRSQIAVGLLGIHNGIHPLSALFYQILI